MRGIFFDEETARLVGSLLADAGFEATVVREPFAGEDDDEDHPWAVVSDAPAFHLEVLVDRHDGWLDDEAPAPAEPLVLPQAPKRHHRPPTD